MARPNVVTVQSRIARLCELSVRRFRNPWDALEWPRALPEDAWCMSPELISIFGTPTWDRMSEPQRQRLSLLEAVNFFSLNIHGEKRLIEGLARRLYATRVETWAPYLHHFLDEENKHSWIFGEFCRRYLGKVYRDKRLPVDTVHTPAVEDLLFFLKVFVFEEIVDAHNAHMGEDERLHPLAQQINKLHHEDETRHLAFNRLALPELLEKHAKTPEIRDELRHAAAMYFEASWRRYYNPDVYRDAGVDDPFGVRREALESERGREHRAEMSRRMLRTLADLGL